MMTAKEKQRIESIRVSPEWDIIPEFFCRACNDPARVHPECDNIWGCLKCSTTTYSLFCYFIPRGEL